MGKYETCLDTGIFDPKKVKIVYMRKEYIEAGRKIRQQTLERQRALEQSKAQKEILEIEE